MRVLLVALNAQKGDLDRNLALHFAILEEAHAQKCDVAVFPEFSLTGSVGPRGHHERALTLDAEPVRKLMKARPRGRSAWPSSSALPNASIGHSTYPRCTATPAGLMACTASASSPRTNRAIGPGIPQGRRCHR
jgi:predicted amidohydrolase